MLFRGRKHEAVTTYMVLSVEPKSMALLINLLVKKKKKKERKQK